MERKKRIRAEYLKQRSELPAAQAIRYSEQICRQLETFPPFLQAETIYFYYPMRKEADLLPLAQWAMKQDKTIGFPKTRDSEMNFFCTRSLHEFKEGRFHVMEPESGCMLTADSALILTPGVVFDKNKNRMGYGKGYYDRYAKRFPRCMRVGIAYGFQIADTIPADELDVPMDAIVTEAGIW